MSKTITVIPARKTLHSTAAQTKESKRRVAAYARVSTDNEEQLTSYEAQVDYYTNHIKNNQNWDFVKVYTDEGISATNTKHREGFKQMIADALDGKIDLILTKSVSRFARNTVDSLTTVRNLKEHGVEVYFEKENIYTFDGKGELLITIMSSLAQEESRSISENVTWGQRKRFADGKVMMPYSGFLGYERGEDGQPKIVEKEAKTVRLIYKLFLEGKTPTYIANYLMSQNILAPRGGNKWSPSTINSILRNEKYKGSALLQKSFTVDFLSKKVKKNNGEIPQYYIEDSHPAIVSKEVYDLVQMELKKRKAGRHYKISGSCFSGMLFCSECGDIYGSKLWHSNNKYRRTVWQCNSKFKIQHKNVTPHFTEDMLKSSFVSVMNELIENKNEIIGFIEQVVEQLSDTTAIDKKVAIQQAKFEHISKQVHDYVELNSRVAINQKEYAKHYNELMSDYDAEEAKLEAIKLERTNLIDRSKKSVVFLKLLKRQDIIQEFDEELFSSTVEKITVFEDKLIFEFKDGTEMEYLLK
jgi:DNA invertase Pin-like site-specific DNA recombinase